MTLRHWLCLQLVVSSWFNNQFRNKQNGVHYLHPFSLTINIRMNELLTSEGFTLIDITKTNEVSGYADNKARNQQRNWETVVQMLGLHVHLIRFSDPTMLKLNMDHTNFGPDFTGEHSVWHFTFSVVHGASYEKLHNFMEGDFINIPIILGLDETAKINSPTFTVSGLQKNIYFAPFKI
jgi:hypothetical protein